MERRELKISSGASGGTAAAGARTYRVTLPSNWIKQMGLDQEGSKVDVVFDGTSIVIRPKMEGDIASFQSQAINAGHSVVKYEYFDKENLCSTLICDFTVKNLRVKNHTEQLLKTAFGILKNPDWKDFMEFLEERCVPKTRENIGYILNEIELAEYDPVQIVEKTQGRMAEDEQWLRITKL